MLSHNPPPFHAEHIGSLLRPSKLLDQRAKFTRDEIDRTELTKAEDEAIKDALHLPQLLLPPTRRDQHRYRRRRGRQRWRAGPTRRTTCRAHQQPRALDPA